jgi:23S rRNA (guanosine2251-2'-O)-methyltransferase
MEKKETIAVYGKNPIYELLDRNPAEIQKVYFKDAARGVSDIQEALSKAKVPFAFVPEKKLRDMAGSKEHQGVVALLSSVPYTDLGPFLEEMAKVKYPCVLVMDEIEDPHNVGAIIRSATAAGAHGIIMGKHNQAGVTGAVYKTSAGTAGKIPIVRVSNINDTIRKLKEARFWIAGLSGENGKNFWQENLESPIAFVVGNEGTGIRQETLKLCDFAISIPMKNSVESLNASVSAALVMYEWRRQGFLHKE